MTIQAILIRLPLPKPDEQKIDDIDYMDLLNVKLVKHEFLKKENIVSIHVVGYGYYIIFYETVIYPD